MNGVIDLNVDVGEGFPWDSDLLALATSANVCCGVHAGSLQTTHATINECTRLGLRFGLHPGYNDRDSMGRAKRELADSTTQMGTLITLKTQCDLVVHAHPNAAYLKPHGAFYNQSAEDDVAADLLADILEHVRLPLMGLAYSLHQKAARRAEVPFIREGFIDRRVDDHQKASMDTDLTPERQQWYRRAQEACQRPQPHRQRDQHKRGIPEGAVPAVHRAELRVNRRKAQHQPNR